MSSKSDDTAKEEKASTGKARKRMRNFLGDLLTSGEVPGLEWVDEKTKTFRMPWKHAKKKGYNSGKDTLLIKLWAINTGRFREENPDPTTWKINFRCALNSLRESIVEIETPPDEDCRIFRFEDSRRGRGKSLGADAAKLEELNAKTADKRKGDDPNELRWTTNEENTCTADDLWSPSGAGPDTVSLQQMLKNLEDPSKISLPPVQPTESVFEERHHPSTSSTVVDSGSSPRSSASTTDSGIYDAEGGEGRLGPNDNIPACHEMYVKVSYRGSPVAGMRVTHPLGCRIFFGEIPEAGRLRIDEQERLFGSRHLMQLCLPQPASAQARLHSMWCLLDSMQRGIVLEVQNNDIYATRLCHPVVFWGSPAHDGYTCELVQGVRTRIFHYQAFLNIYRSYNNPQRNGIASEPQSYEVILGVGQPWGPERNRDNNLLVISVTHCLAETLMETLHRYRWETSCPFDTDYLMIDNMEEDDKKAMACSNSHPGRSLLMASASMPAILSPGNDDLLAEDGQEHFPGYSDTDMPPDTF